jgi:hypothetical protein
MGWDARGLWQCFLSGVWSEAVQATPTASHHAVAKLAENNRLLRYTVCTTCIRWREQLAYTHE